VNTIKISLSCAGSYAVSEIYNGLKHAVENSPHTLSSPGGLNIMVRGDARKSVPRPNILILTDEPYEVDRTVQFSGKYDLVFTNDRSTLRRHKNAVFLPFGYDPAVITIAKNNNGYLDTRPIDICHVGGCYPGRKDFIIPLFKHFTNNTALVGIGWPRLTKNQKQLIPFHDHVTLYKKSKIVVNVHRNNTYSCFGRKNRGKCEATHLAPRVWTCGAVGSFQIVDNMRQSEEVPSLVTVNSPAELINKCEYYLKNKRELAAAAGKQAKEIRPHSWAERLEFIIKTAHLRGLIR